MKILSVHDRLPPYEVRNINVQEDYTFRLMGGNKVEEVWANRPIANEHGSVNIGGFEGTGAANLGAQGGKITWRVLGPHKMQRVHEGSQFINIMDFEITEPNQCAVEARYLLQKGKTAMITRRRDNGELAEFSINKVTDAKCWIE